MMGLQVMGYDNKEGKEKQDSREKKYHIMVSNKHRLVNELQYMNTLEN